MFWNHPLYSSSSWICDVPGVGRYLIERREPRSREFILKLNNVSTKYYGTVDELKKIVERITVSKAL